MMKINTEIVNTFFVVTCEGRRLDAPFAQNFFNSMQSIIQKGHMDIVLDLSSVEFVDSTGLGAIVRCLKELDNRGNLVLCGVNKMVLSLLKMTRLDDVFIQAATREEAFKKLAAVKKGTKPTQTAPIVQPAAPPPQPKGFDNDLLSSLKMEGEETIQEVGSGERRKHQRLDKKQILNEDIIVRGRNLMTGKSLTAVILNISPGGLLLVSPAKLTVGHEFILEGRIGRNFKFREQAVIRNNRDRKYGLEFIRPSEKTTAFLHQLTGSVMLSKGQLNQS